MRIVVIGAGAIGGLYGGMLAHLAGEEVWMLDVWDEHIHAINSKGLLLISPDEQKTTKPKATTNVEEIGSADLIIICVKSADTSGAGMVAKLLSKPSTIMITLQNGLGNLEILQEVTGSDRLLVAATQMVAMVLEPGHIWYGGIRPTYISPGEGCDGECAKIVANLLERAGLQVEIEGNYKSLLWSKLAVHAAYNVVTAITGLRGAEFADSEEAKYLAKKIIDEIVSVAKAQTIKLLPGDFFAMTMDRAVTIGEQHSSMLLDILHKRQTEVQMIIGPVVEASRRIGVQAPYNEAVYNILRIMEQHYKKA